MLYDDALVKAISGDGFDDLHNTFFQLDVTKAHVTAHFRKNNETGKLEFIHDYEDSRHRHELAVKFERGNKVKIAGGKYEGKEGVFHSYDSKYDDTWVKIDNKPVAFKTHKVKHVDTNEPEKVKTEEAKQPENRTKQVTTETPVAQPTQPQTPKIPDSFTNDTAKEFIKGIADTMEKAGLHPYLSNYYSDSQIKGISNYSNVENWTLVDGDNPHPRIKQMAKPGTVEVGVAVWGKKLNVEYHTRITRSGDEERERFEPDYGHRQTIATKIKTALTKAGYPVKEVSLGGYDSGWGTKNIGYGVVLERKKSNPPQGGNKMSNTDKRENDKKSTKGTAAKEKITVQGKYLKLPDGITSLPDERSGECIVFHNDKGDHVAIHTRGKDARPFADINNRYGETFSNLEELAKWLNKEKFRFAGVDDR